MNFLKERTGLMSKMITSDTTCHGCVALSGPITGHGMDAYCGESFWNGHRYIPIGQKIYRPMGCRKIHTKVLNHEAQLNRDKEMGVGIRSDKYLCMKCGGECKRHVAPLWAMILTLFLCDLSGWKCTVCGRVWTYRTGM